MRQFTHFQHGSVDAMKINLSKTNQNTIPFHAKRTSLYFKHPQRTQIPPIKALSTETSIPDRRQALLTFATIFTSLTTIQLPVLAQTVTINPSLAPDQSLYDPSDPQLRAAAQLLQQALNAETVEKEEQLWTEIITKYGKLDANWVPDLVGRAYGNRGNSRARQGKLNAALDDYNTAIKLCPWSVDPVLNRGAVYEALGRFEEAIQDYTSVLAVDPNDPAAYNNLGNAYAGTNNWEQASTFYTKAVSLAPQFSFAACNKAIADFQLGRDDSAFKQFRTLLRRYPESFPDARAALAAALWEVGLQAQAEEEWGRVNDPRYRDLAWINKNRRWPPRLVHGLTAFLSIQDVK